MTIRDGLLVGDKTVSPYDGDPRDGMALPLTATKSSQINAEFVYRGNTIERTNRITLPASTKEGRTADAVDDRVKAIRGMNAGDTLEQARTLWEGMLEAISYPNDDQTHACRFLPADRHTEGRRRASRKHSSLCAV
ncbi:hypothetical protein [Arthrobacter sp. ISL-72]|uniref:hypothetical protein n=1 Tax=Arthrobacter sp. ISL-72 TaxID=2819114 RepID=UPI001BEA8AB7|nr:hypothetical protein [Arthrobacter sp. ISL-72]MBT2597931.1 hypothetical protein [Arthrobacter sp. ISL-72]